MQRRPPLSAIANIRILFVIPNSPETAMNRPDLDPALPRYTIKYLAEEGGWQLSKWKMTIAYAVKQYAGLEWDPVLESEEFIDPKDMPVSGQSFSHLLRNWSG